MQQRIRFIVFAFLAVFIACAVCFKFVFTEKPFEAIEKCQWNSIEVSYCLGDGPDVTKKSQIILDKEVLSKLKASFCGHSWAYAELHVLSKWNKIAISLDDGNKEMLVLYPNKACYYASDKKAVTIDLGPNFENYLIEVLRINESDETVHLFYDTDRNVKNQEKMLIPDDNKWTEESFPGADKGKGYH